MSLPTFVVAMAERSFEIDLLEAAVAEFNRSGAQVTMQYPELIRLRIED